MKRWLTILLALLLIFQIGCGTGEEPEASAPTPGEMEETQSPQPEDSAPAQELEQSSEPEQTPEPEQTAEPEQGPEADGLVLVLQDPWAFLGGSTLSEEQAATAGSKKLTFELKPEEDVLALQYVELLLNGAYRLEKADMVETESDTAHAYACYFRYTGAGELPVLDMGSEPCNLFIGIRRDNGEKRRLL